MAPRIHHSKENPASNNWECVPDPVTPHKLTIQRNAAAPPKVLKRSRGTTKAEISPASVTPKADWPTQDGTLRNQPLVGQANCCPSSYLMNAFPTPCSYLLQSSCFGPLLQDSDGCPCRLWPEAPVSRLLPLLHRIHGCYLFLSWSLNLPVILAWGYLDLVLSHSFWIPGKDLKNLRL